MPVTLPTAFQNAITKAGKQYGRVPATVVVEIAGFPMAFSNQWLPVPWTANTYRIKNEQVCVNGNLYRCISPGTTANPSGPSGSGGGDGTTSWSLISALGTPATWPGSGHVYGSGNNLILVNGNVWLGSAGTTGSSMPAGLAALSPAPGTSVVDGSVHWWICTPWRGGTNYTNALSYVVSSGNVYECSATGVSAGGPTGTGSSITDGGAVWQWIGTGNHWYAGQTRFPYASWPLRILRCLQTDKDGKIQGLEFGATPVDHTKGRAENEDVKVALVDIAAPSTDVTLSVGALLATLRSDNQFRLQGDLDRFNSAFAIDGSYTVPAQITAGSVVYCGLEAMLVTQVVAPSGSGYNTQYGYAVIQRGWYGTVPQPHNGNAVLGSGQGDILTLYPRSITDRKVWVRYGLEAASDLDCISVFTGVVNDYGVANGGLSVWFDAWDQKRISRPIFTSINDAFFLSSQTKGPNNPHLDNPDDLTVTLEFADPSFPAQLPSVIDLPPGFGQTNQILVYDYSDPSGLTTSPPRPKGFFFFLGDTICGGSVAQNVSATKLVLEDVGFFVSKYVYDPSVTELQMRPCIPVTRGHISTELQGDLPDLTLPWLDTVTPTVGGGAIDGDHPLVILLQVLLSTGGTWQQAPTPTCLYDTLPKTWGLGIPPSEVDIAGIERIAQRYPNYKVRIVVTDIVTDARDWLTKELLAPFGWYFTVNADSTITVHDQGDPPPKALLSIPSIGVTDLATDPKTGQFLKLDGPTCKAQDRFVRLKWSDSPYVSQQALSFRDPVVITATDDLNGLAKSQTAQPLEITSSGLYSPLLYPTPVDPGTSGVFGSGQITVSQALVPPDGALPGSTIAARLIATLQKRYSVPPFAITVELRPLRFGLSVGDLVSVTLPNLPSPFSPTRGWSAVICEVTSRRPILSRGTIEVELTASSIGTAKVRYLAPSLSVTAYNATSHVLTVQKNAFTDSSGTHVDTTPFATGLGDGYLIRVYSSDGLERSSAVYVLDATVGSTTIDLTLSAAVTMDISSRVPAAGDVVQLSDYADESGSSAVASYAYRSTPQPSPVLGSTDGPDVYA